MSRKTRNLLHSLMSFLLVMAMILTPFFSRLPVMAADSEVDCQAILDTKDSLHLAVVGSDNDSAVQTLEIEKDEIIALTVSPQTAAQPLGWEVSKIDVSDESILEVLDELPDDANVGQDLKSELTRKDALFVILRGKQTGSVTIDVQLENPAWEKADADHYQPVGLKCESTTVPQGTKAARAASAAQRTLSNGSEVQTPSDYIDNGSADKTDQNQPSANQPTVPGNSDNNGGGNSATKPGSSDSNNGNQGTGDENQGQKPDNPTQPDDPSNNPGGTTDPDKPDDPTPPACDFCGSTEHTTAEHPLCSVCGSPDHKAEDHCTKCSALGHTAEDHCGKCNAVGHRAEDHCSFCDGIDHSVDDHTCTICDGIFHTAEDHCAECGSLEHAADAHCGKCGSIDHSIDAHMCTKCDGINHVAEDHCSECGSLEHSADAHCGECGSLDHTVDAHCPICHDIGHTADAHCKVCTSMDHTADAHCGECGSLDHATSAHCTECGSLDHAASAHCPICSTIEHQLHPLDLSGLSLTENNFVYNGEAPDLSLTGAPDGVDLKFNVVSDPATDAGDHQYTVAVEVPEGYAPVSDLTFDYVIEPSPIKVTEQHNQIEQDGQTIDKIDIVTEGIVTSDIEAVDQVVTDAKGNQVDNFNLNTAAPGSYQVTQAVKIKDDKVNNYVIETSDELEDTGVYNIKSNHQWLEFAIEPKIANNQLVVEFYAHNIKAEFANEAVKASIGFNYAYDETQLEYVQFQDGRFSGYKDSNRNNIQAGTTFNNPIPTIGSEWYIGALTFNIIGDAKDIIFTANNIRLTPTVSTGDNALSYTYVVADTSVVINPEKIEQHDIVVEHDPMDDVIYTGAADDKATADAALQEYIGETWEDLKKAPEQPNPDIGGGTVIPGEGDWDDENTPGFGESNEEINLAIVENSVVTAVEEAVLAEGTGDVIVAEELPTAIEAVEETVVTPAENNNDIVIEVVNPEISGTEVASESDSELITSTDTVEVTPSVTADNAADSLSSSSESAPATTVEPAENATSSIPEAPAVPASYEAPAAA